jgi:hypothetical protein
VADIDLTQLLADWPFEPGRTSVRLITGADGTRKMQVRVPLGVLQLELSGRPDGARPEGFESLLDLHLDRLRRYQHEGGGAAGFVLSADECRDLREEAVLYYHRYVGLFLLEEFDGVVRDATRNLQVLDLCRDHAAAESDREVLEQFRPYILMMRTRAQASIALAKAQPKQALAHIDDGIAAVTEALSDLGMGDHLEESNELQLLHGMRDMLVPKLPTSQRVELEERLKAAIDAENYELAAILRDELKMLRE